ncbi:LPS-assembly protein LptD [Candidatus Phycosocius spiralis]|uniref:LPS-assembly protein LptD n=1 Tax=Candidatus Phycosocius spiralis TaxID=2815099 RepID=A0ABQ4PSM6_9PROT|nr:LPS assembly protein LptD [Candidatus Phycosocius spiralis]GIU66007.1 LPS-assembly protein LptD [Candidatus Phycosocius spiralis]
MSRVMHHHLLVLSLTNLLVPDLAQAQSNPPLTSPTLASSTPAPSNQTSSNLAQIDDPVLLEADSVEQGDEAGVFMAKGNVTAKHKGRTVQADQIIYNQKTGVVTASGHVKVFNADGSSTFADELSLEDDLSTAVIGSFASRFADGSTLAANAAVSRKGDRKYLSQAVFTACSICTIGHSKPSWIIRARRAMQNERAQLVSYNDVVFEVKGVPVIYVPYFAHSDPSVGRRSGVLQPKPGETSRNGYFVEIPYLQVLDPYSDLTLTPLISQYINPVLLLDYRRKFYSGSLDLSGSITREKFFGKRGEKIGTADWRSHLYGNGSFKINDLWKWGFTAETASDDLYLFRYRFGETSPQSGLIRPQPSRLMSQIYLEAQGGHFYARTLSAAFQDLIPGDRRKNVPKIVPLIDGTHQWLIGPMHGRLDVSGTAVSLQRSEGRLDSIRANLGANWRGSQIIAGGVVFEPSAFLRGDYFNYSAGTNSGPIADNPLPAETFGRAVGSASLELKWPLFRAGKDLNWNLEPQFSLTTASQDRQKDRIRVEDAQGFEMDATSVMRPLGAAGTDLWEPGNRLSLGVRTGFDLKPPQSSAVPPLRATAFLGRRIRAQDSLNFSRASNLDKKLSDWVTDFSIENGAYASLNGRFRIDADTGKITHSEASGRLKVWRAEGTLRYHDFAKFSADPTRANKELQGTFTLELTKNIKLMGTLFRDLNSNTNLRWASGLAYHDDCTDVRVFYEEIGTQNRFIEPSYSIRFQIAFRTLGELSDGPFN